MDFGFNGYRLKFLVHVSVYLIRFLSDSMVVCSSCIIDEEETTEEPIPRLPKEPSLMKRPKNVVHALPS